MTKKLKATIIKPDEYKQCVNEKLIENCEGDKQRITVAYGRYSDGEILFTKEIIIGRNEDINDYLTGFSVKYRKVRDDLYDELDFDGKPTGMFYEINSKIQHKYELFDK